MYTVTALAAAYVTTLLSLSSTAFASPFNLDERAGKPPSLSTVYQFDKVGQVLENIAVRSNGDLLVTRIDVPELWLVKPEQHQATRLFTFPNATICTGLTEFKDDVFAVASGSLDFSIPAVVPKSAVVWKVDLSGPKPDVSVLKAIPEADFLNGLTPLDKRSGIILAVDSSKARIWRLNTKTGAYSVALTDSTMAAADPKKEPTGVNGVKVRKNYVYYTSSTKQLFCRVKVDSQGSAVGPFETIANTGQSLDDFALAEDGSAYIASYDNHDIIKFTPRGQLSTVIGGPNSTVLAGPAACQFSRKNKDVLYVATSGAVRNPVNGVFREPARVVAINLKDLKHY